MPVVLKIQQLSSNSLHYEQVHSLFSAFKIADVRHLGFQYEILTVDRTKFRMSPNQVCVLLKNKAITDLELQ